MGIIRAANGQLMFDKWLKYGKVDIQVWSTKFTPAPHWDPWGPMRPIGAPEANTVLEAPRDPSAPLRDSRGVLEAQIPKGSIPW